MLFFSRKEEKMKKIINIDGKEYTIKSSAFTQFAYKDMTGRSLLKDLQSMINVVSKENVEKDMSVLEQFIEPILDMTYIMLNEADEKQVSSKDDFLKNIECLYDDWKWIEDVIFMAVNPLSRQLQKDINNIK